MEKPLNCWNTQTGSAVGNQQPSLASDCREGSETIAEASTAKRLEKGASLPSKEGYDIVRTALKDAGIICNKCGIAQPRTEYYYRNKVCKTCYKKRVGQYQKGAGRSSHLEANKKYHANHPDRGGWKPTRKNQIARMERYKKMMLECPEKVKAQWTISNMLRSGELKKPNKCSCCGMLGRIEGHHPNYAEPKVVEWLCVHCHKSRHKMIGME